MISARELGKRFGEKEVLKGVSLELPEGTFLLVSGRNGSGKSTLLRLFARLLAHGKQTRFAAIANGNHGLTGAESEDEDSRFKATLKKPRVRRLRWAMIKQHLKPRLHR